MNIFSAIGAGAAYILVSLIAGRLLPILLEHLPEHSLRTNKVRGNRNHIIIKTGGNMKKITLFFFLIILCFSLCAQKEYVEKNKNYSLARIYKKDYKILKVNNLELVNDTLLTYKLEGGSQKGELSVSDVKYVSVRKGSKALPFGLAGAGIGLVSVAITHATHSSDPYTEDFNWTPMYVGFTVGYGVIGAFIGAFSYKWKRLYFQNNDLASRIMIYPNFQRNTYGIGVVLTF